MLTRKNLKKYIADYIKTCNELGVYFQKVILFGSYAKKEERKWSDVDLALVSDNFSDKPLDDRRKISPANILFCDIEPHPYSTAYFKKGDPLIDEIKRTGIEIKV